MSFDSIFFLSCFLPLTLVIYWLLPGYRARQGALLVISLLFFGFAGLAGIPLLAVFAGVNYLAGLGIHHGFHGKLLRTGTVIFDLCFLGCFKYLHFFLTELWHLPQEAGSLVAPLGISFFVFKAISYVVDLSRNPQTSPGSFPGFLLYLSFFPQALAGPISRYGDFVPLRNPTPWNTRGLPRFLVGLAKKVLLCGVLATAVDDVYSLSPAQLTLPLAWLAAIGYTLQIYFDFSGYSDMAIGLSQMLGFPAPENFNHPYTATSLTDFWRRWHMSLSGWFRDYLYIPLGGNRKGKLRTAVHKMIVFTLCGLWHGAGWTFLLWGAWHGIFTAAESLGFRPKGLPGRLYTLLVVTLGFVVFRAQSVSQGWAIIQAMFTPIFPDAAGLLTLQQLATPEFLLVCGVSLGLCTPLASRLMPQDDTITPLGWVGCLGLYLLCLLALAGGNFTPFIYAQF